MGRLTLRNVFGKARCKKNGTKFCYETDECLYCKHNYEILERLAHYEDLEEAGRLIELPCAVGDTVWVVDLGVDKKITKQIDGEMWHRVVRERNITERCFVISDYGQLGRYVFLTKEEAEAKLKELEGVKEW